MAFRGGKLSPSAVGYGLVRSAVARDCPSPSGSREIHNLLQTWKSADASKGLTAQVFAPNIWLPQPDAGLEPDGNSHERRANGGARAFRRSGGFRRNCAPVGTPHFCPGLRDVGP